MDPIQDGDDERTLQHLHSHVIDRRARVRFAAVVCHNAGRPTAWVSGLHARNRGQ